MYTKETYNAAKKWWDILSTTLKKHYIKHYKILNDPMTIGDIVYIYKWETADI